MGVGVNINSEEFHSLGDALSCCFLGLVAVAGFLCVCHKIFGPGI